MAIKTNVIRARMGEFSRARAKWIMGLFLALMWDEV